MHSLLMYYKANPEQGALVLFIMYLVVFIDLRYVHPERCEKHGTNLSTSGILGCQECLLDSMREYRKEQVAREEAKLKHKAEVYASTLAAALALELSRRNQ